MGKARGIRLWKRQNGKCWICGHLMIIPDLIKPPNAWTCTVDHIGEKNGMPRPVKGAHLKCNGKRKHLELEDMGDWIKEMNNKFQNQQWVMSVFGKQNTGGMT